LESLARVALICTTRLFEFLNSGEYVHLGIKLDDSLQCRFVTISEPHIRSLRRRRGEYNPTSFQDDDVVGAGTNTRTCPYNWLTLIPKGYTKNVMAFEGQCLLVSVVLGNLLNLSREPGGDTAPHTTMLNNFLNYPSLAMTKKLGSLIRLQIKELQHKLKIEYPIKLGLSNALAKHFKSQIFIYNHEAPPKVIGIYPPKINLSLKPIHLYCTKKTESDLLHTDLIKNLPMYQNSRGFTCISCNFSTPFFQNLRHSCRNKLTLACFCCHRTLMNRYTYVNQGIKELFCDSQLEQLNYEPKDCSGCGITFKSESCRSAHTKEFCTRKGFTCKKDCGKFVFQMRTQENIDRHVCRLNPYCKRCKQDFVTGETPHQCPFSPPAKFSSLENLGIVQFSYSSSTAQCKQCFEKTCDLHPGTDSFEIRPILANLLYEHDVHGQFSRMDFYDPQFQKPMKTEERALTFDYLAETNLEPKLDRAQKTFRFKQPMRRNAEFDLALEALRDKPNKSVAESLLAQVLCLQFQNFSFLTTEAKGVHVLLRAAVANHLTPKRTMVKGSQAICFSFPYFGIRFLSMKQYLTGNVANLIDQFQLQTEELYHPSLLPLDEDLLLGKTLERAPPFHYYAELMDTKETQEKKLAFWKEIQEKPFHYLTSLENCANRQLNIISFAVLHLVQMSLDLQGKCLKIFGIPNHFKENSVLTVPFFHHVSLSSFLKATFRSFCLEDNTLYAVPGDFSSRIAVSRAEQQATEYLRFKQKGQWQTEYSSPQGQKKFFCREEKSPFLLADGFSESKKQVFLFNGCFWHGHSCEAVSQKEKDNPRHEKKYKKLMAQCELLLAECGDEVCTVTHLWECEFNSLLNNSGLALPPLPEPFEELKLCNSELIDFIENMRPFDKMSFRDALSASLSETYSLKYVKEEGDNQKCYALDVSSLYSTVGIENLLPQGPYQSIIGDKLSSTKVTFEGTNMFLDGQHVIAICHARVFPPPSLLLPFLQTQVNGVTVGTLCRTCSENAERRDSIVVCSHSPMERSFVSTMSSCEVAYAASLNYSFEFFELAVYKKTSHFLRPFLTLLAFQKLMYSDYPREAVTDEQRAQYCESVNVQMQFPELIGMEFSPSVVSPNIQRRTFAKSCLNQFLGTFGANSSKGCSIDFIEHYQKLLSYVRSDRIVDLVPINDSILQVTLKNVQNPKCPSRSSNVSTSITITALARVFIHRKMEEVRKLGATLLRVSTDSIFFVLDAGVPLPFPISQAFGNFQHQHENIEAVVQIGLRNLSVLFKGEDGHLQEHLTTGGIKLSQYNERILSHAKYKQVVDTLFQEDPEHAILNTKVCNVQYRNSVKKPKIKCVPKKQSAFNNLIHVRRQFIPSSRFYSSLPYGYVP
jgi:hypothetical protein